MRSDELLGALAQAATDRDADNASFFDSLSCDFGADDAPRARPANRVRLVYEFGMPVDVRER